MVGLTKAIYESIKGWQNMSLEELAQAPEGVEIAYRALKAGAHASPVFRIGLRSQRDLLQSANTDPNAFRSFCDRQSTDQARTVSGDFEPNDFFRNLSSLAWPNLNSAAKDSLNRWSHSRYCL